MSKGKKWWLILAAILTAAGLVIFLGAMAVLDFDFRRLNLMKFETNTYEAEEAFDRIVIDVDTTEIEFARSDSAQCKIVCIEREREKHTAAVKDGTLTIGTLDTRKWYDYIGFSFGSPKLTVYLPREKYASLSVNTHTGDLEIPADFAFENLTVSGTTADVNCMASVSDIMNIELTTGDIEISGITAGALALSATTGRIELSSVTCNGAMEVSTTTGGMKLTDVTCQSLTSRGDTGRMILKNVIASDSMSIERSTGNVVFEGSDAEQIQVKTSTGHVTGTLLSPKVFVTETGTGRVRVPKTASGGKCEITTGTGNIEIDIP